MKRIKAVGAAHVKNRNEDKVLSTKLVSDRMHHLLAFHANKKCLLFTVVSIVLQSEKMLESASYRPGWMCCVFTTSTWMKRTKKMPPSTMPVMTTSPKEGFPSDGCRRLTKYSSLNVRKYRNGRRDLAKM